MSLPRRAIVVGALALLVSPRRLTAADDAVLRVAVGVGPVASPFWAVRDAGGALRGMTVDMGRALAARLNRKAEIVAYDNSGAITDDAARGAWDVTFVPMDDARQARLDFGPVYDDAEATYLVGADARIETLADVDRADVRVAAIAGTATGRAAQASLKNAKVAAYATVAEVMACLRDGKVDAFALPRGLLDNLAKTLPGSRVLPGFFARTIAAIAVPKGRPELHAAAVAFMREAEQNGLLRDIRAQNRLP